MIPEIESSQLCQFVEASSHFILSQRGLYPDAIFVSRLAFGVPVKFSIHPEVNKFIENSLDGFLAALDSKSEGETIGIDLVISDYDGDLVEKYAFRFGNLRIKPKEKYVLADKELREHS